MSGRENFPVGSLLIRRDLRAVVAAFYAFARAADDAADDPALGPDVRLARLARFEAGLDGAPGGAPVGLALLALGRPEVVAHARRLLSAFRQDAAGGRIGTWADLQDYCDRSANPVGRFLLDLHGEDPATAAPSDALCTALQVLNHLQDVGADHRRLGRCYLPADWMDADGAGPADLAAERLSPALRRVVHRALDRCDLLLGRAADLPGRLASRRLAGEATTILALARALSDRLRRGDPLAGRVALGRFDWARAGVAGLVVAAGPRTRARLLPRRGAA